MVAILLASLVRAEAEVLLSDAFDYPNGSLVVVGAGQWVHHSGTTSGEVQVSSGRALLTEADTEDVSAVLLNPLPASTNLTIYVGATVRFTTLPGSGEQYFLHLKNGTTGFRAKTFATMAVDAPGSFHLGVTEGENSGATYLTNYLNLTTDYRLVLRYSINSAATALWIDPNSEADPFVTATDSSTAVDIVAVALRQSTNIGNIQIDDLVMGTTFNDVVLNVVPQPPTILSQPQSQTATAGKSTSLSVLASGTSPFGYQWQLNGVDVTGATEPTLLFTNVSTSDAGIYTVTVSNAVGVTNSLPAALAVVVVEAPFSVLDYNVKGNGVADWSTNSLQVRAIGRQVEYLDPDIITFQEIPYTNAWQMVNFVAAFRPGFNLAANSGNDGYIQSVILSRYPINRSRKWLDGINLATYGYAGNFTRDLFEAEIAVPGYSEPVHVFTTHLKAGQGTDDSAKRAAEANAISNYFVNGFLTTNASRPYLLTGDMNEDINRPPSSHPQTIERLISTPTGLQLTTPVNPYTGSELTISIQSGMYARYDYILPCGTLLSNMQSSEVFRSDKLPAPPAPLLGTDSSTASDHLPVMAVFGTPFQTPFRLLSLATSNEVVSLTWESTPGGIYALEATTNFNAWGLMATNLMAMGTNLTHVFAPEGEAQYYRVVRLQP